MLSANFRQQPVWVRGVFGLQQVWKTPTCVVRLRVLLLYLC